MGARDLTGKEGMALATLHQRFLNAQKDLIEYRILLIQDRGLDPDTHAVDMANACIVEVKANKEGEKEDGS